MLVEKLLLGIIVFSDSLVFREQHIGHKVVDTSENTINFLFNFHKFELEICLDCKELLAHFIALNELSHLLLGILKGPLVDGKGPTFTAWLWHIMRLIKYQHAVLNEFLVLLIEIVIEQVVIGHEEQVADGLDKWRIVVWTEVIGFTQLLDFLSADYLVLELSTGQL